MCYNMIIKRIIYFISKYKILFFILILSMVGYNNLNIYTCKTINWNSLQSMLLNKTTINKINIIDGTTAIIYGEKKYMMNIPYISYIENKVNNLETMKNNTYNIPVNYINNTKYYELFLKFFYSAFTILALYMLFKLCFNKTLDIYDINVDEIKSKKSNTKIEDVAGLFNSKKELLELIDIFVNFKKFQKLGGKIPKGALLEGPPGTGKTMLARAIAEHYKMNFILCSGSDLIKPIVGTGSIQVKEIFKNARKNAPTILFIDEIDAIGKTRDANSFSGNERENILNSLLVELDGFEVNDKVFTIAATNRSDVLDKALTRPGRFDRCIQFQLPNIDERKDILNTYFNKMELDMDKEFMLKELSFETYGFSGADLANLCNEAAIIAGKEDKEQILDIHFRKAIDYINMGGILHYKLHPDEKHIVAIHESGHALISHLVNDINRPNLITIIPRTKGALGYTKILPDYEKKLYKYEDYFDQICVLLGGRLAEKLILGKITNGAYDDINKVNKIAREMITKLGMTPELSLSNIIIEEKERKFYSERLTQDYDSRIIDLIKEAENKVETLLTQHIDILTKLTEILEEKEILYLNDINEIFYNKPLDK